jgi:hypothetical protein
LRFDGEGTAALAEDAAWDLQIRRLWQSQWVVYPKATAKNPEQALDYLGRYTHRVAISDNRILNVQDGAQPRGSVHRHYIPPCRVRLLPPLPRNPATW